MKITKAALDAIKAHGAEGYPFEICGLLVGSEMGFVTDIRRLRNINADSPRNRYDVDPM